MMEGGWAAADFDLSPLAPPENSRLVGAGGQEHSQGAEDKVGAAVSGDRAAGEVRQPQAELHHMCVQWSRRGPEVRQRAPWSRLKAKMSPF